MRNSGWHSVRGFSILVALSGCSSTDYDLIAADQPSTSGDAGVVDAPVDSASDVAEAGGDADAGFCQPIDFPAPEPLRLRNVFSNLCLASGDPIQVNTQPGFALTLVPCDGAPETAFSLIPSPSRGFEVRHIGLNLNVDVRQADTADGTPLVLFTPHDLSNQRFVFRPRVSRGQEMAPWLALVQCVAQRGAGVEIWACDTMDLTQRWELLPESCFP